jgi:serine/threonine-protein kinase
MATVFLAHDLRHDRPVALKVLHPIIASGVGSGRFEREIRVAARLQHPHIVPLLDSGESPDAPGEPNLVWFVMPFVDGESLRDWLNRETQLSVADALRVVVEIADALEYAHGQGVIHRDIKPENILLSGNHALVADFGIARAVSRDNGAEGQNTTATGTAVGTIAYMSPEQSSGEAGIDGRSDQYSLACVLYELLVGEPPFTGPTAQIVITRRFTEEPRSLRSTRPGVPVEVDRAVARALSRNPADRFATTADFARALHAPASEPVTTSATPRLRSRAVVALAGVVALVAVGGFFAVQRLRASNGADDYLSLAVLPFENRGDSADAYFADGVTDEIRGKLANLPRFRVIARASANQYRGSHKALPEISEELGVRYLLTGTIRSYVSGSEHRLRVNTELVEVSSRGARVMPGGSGAFDATSLTDVFQVQAVIATKIASALQVVITPAAAAVIAAAPTANIAAYDEFLRGEAAYVGSSGPVSQEEARNHYVNAVTLDSSFARAWARLSQVASSIFAGSLERSLDSISRTAAAKALSLDPKLPEAHLAIGNRLTLVVNDYPRAIAAYQAGLALRPTHSELLGAIGLAEQGRGRMDQAIEFMRQAQELDPRSLLLARRLTRAFTWARRFPEAEAMSRKALEIGPADASALQYAVLLRLAQGDIDGARAITRSIPSAANLPDLLAYWSTFFPISGWFLDDEHKQLLLRLPVSAFANRPADRWLAFMFLSLQRGDSARARQFADSSIRVSEPLARLNPHPAWMVTMGWLHAVLGRKAQAIREGEEALASQGNDLVFGQEIRHGLIQIYLLVGEREKALDQLEAFQSIPYYMTPAWIRIDPTLAALRDHPRFRKLVDQTR